MIQQAEQVNSIIDHLAAKLSVPASHLWAVLVRQGYLTGFQDLLWGAIWLGIAVTLFILGRRLCKHLDATYQQELVAKRDTSWARGDWTVGIFWTRLARGVLVAVICLIAAAFFSNSIVELRNPEYQALKAILTLVVPPPAK